MHGRLLTPYNVHVLQNDLATAANELLVLEPPVSSGMDAWRSQHALLTATIYTIERLLTLNTEAVAKFTELQREQTQQQQKHNPDLGNIFNSNFSNKPE